MYFVGVIWTLKFSPDGSYLASGGQDGKIMVWTVGNTTGNTASSNSNSNNMDSVPKAPADSNSNSGTSAGFQLLDRTPHHIFTGLFVYLCNCTPANPNPNPNPKLYACCRSYSRCD